MNATGSFVAAPSGYDTDGRLVYAIGDIHGRADVVAPLIDWMIDDAMTRAGAFDRPPLIVFLGDYIDRGRQSRQVIDLVLGLTKDPRLEVRCLLGNHEDAMLDFIDRRTSGVGWSKRGGRETMESYGVRCPSDPNNRDAWSAARAAFARQVPEDHVGFLRGLELVVTCGDFLFVHAGVRPDVPLEAQARTDLLWIRSEFLGHEHALGRVVVHGHTPAEKGFIGDRRIGLDTGAYASGLLSAARLDGGPPILIESRGGQVVAG